MTKIKLHIGGTEPKEGWSILNAVPGPHVDYAGDIRDMSQFDDNSCDVIYGSHVLEHVGHGVVSPTLKGFRRILTPGGKLMLSVPDLDIICWAILGPLMGLKQKQHFMGMLYGGQGDEYDYHYTGFNYELMEAALTEAGFTNIERVREFGLFQDGSVYAPYGFPISLNVVCEKPA